MNDFIGGIHEYIIKHNYLLIIAIFLFTILTLLLTLLPARDITLPSHFLSHDKLGHFILFGGWTFLTGYYHFTKKPDRTNLILIFIAGVVFGGCVEVLQGIMPVPRDPSFLDWAADAAGAFCATCILFVISKKVGK